MKQPWIQWKGSEVFFSWLTSICSAESTPIYLDLRLVGCLQKFHQMVVKNGDDLPWYKP